MAWLNRTVIGAGLTSFLADVGYELATALMPSFLLLLGLPFGQAAQVMGGIEAAADFLSNAAKLLVGWHSDRVGKRKALVVFGYALTGGAFALAAVATAWPLVLAAKCVGWLGKGIRGPLRNAIITDAVDPAHRGKAFGFHRAGDCLGAVVGPLLAAELLLRVPVEWVTEWYPVNPAGPFWLPYDTTGPYRLAFWFTLIPGLLAAVTFALMVREKRFTPKPGLRLGASLAALPAGYKRWLIGVGIFGLGDFAPTLLILTAMEALDLSQEVVSTAPIWIINGAVYGMRLYALRNFVQAMASFPAGWACDRFGPRRTLTVGYLLGAVSCVVFAFLALAPSTRAMFVPFELLPWVVAFALSGVYNAIQETVEPAVVPQLVPEREVHGTAYGVLAVVNGFGDVGASLTVGYLFWTFNPTVGLLYAAVLMLAGAGWMAVVRFDGQERADE